VIVPYPSIKQCASVPNTWGWERDAEAQQFQHSILWSGPSALVLLQTRPYADRKQHWMRKLEWYDGEQKGKYQNRK
jgi:hypothetical protein